MTDAKNSGNGAKMNDATFIAIGLVIALIIGVAAVFLASGDPDGLESASLYVQGEKDLTSDAPEDADPEAVGLGTFEYSSPFPDYSWEDLGKMGDIIALVLGIVIVFVLIFGVSRIIKIKA